ncbi:hypothetical protein [Geoglobus sp.]
MEHYYALLVMKFLAGILLVFVSIFALLIDLPILTLIGMVAGIYLSVSAYREGSKSW